MTIGRTQKLPDSNKVASATYSSVADLQAAASEKFIGGAEITLTNYYPGVDFGEPIVLVVESAAAGINSFVLQDGRYANLYTSGPVNVKWFGAKGTSTAYTDVWDDRPFIQDAIDSLYSLYNSPAKVSAVLYFPSGYYNIQSTQTVLDIDGNSIEVGLNFAGSDSLYKTTEAYQDFPISFLGEDTLGYHAQDGTIISSGDQLAGAVDALCYFYKGECKEMRNFLLYGNQVTHTGLWVNSGWHTTTGLLSHSNFENIYSAYCIQAVKIECVFKTQVKNVRGALSIRGIDIQPVTSLYASQLAVSSYVESGITIGAEDREGGRYSSIEDCVVESKIKPSNHLFGKGAATPFGENANFWIDALLTNYPAEAPTAAEFADRTFGAAYRCWPGYAVVNFNNCGTENIAGASIFSVVETASGYGTVNIMGGEGEGGGGAYPEWDGTTSSYKGTINEAVNLDVPKADGSSIALTTLADYTTKLAEGSIVFIGKRVSGAGPVGALGDYLGPDDIISDETAGNTVLYGFGLILTSVSATTITGTRTSNLTGNNWPVGTDYPAGVGANGEGELTGDEYIWKLVPDDRDVVYYSGTRESVNVQNFNHLGWFRGHNRYQNCVDFITAPAGLSGKLRQKNVFFRSITDELELALSHIDETIYPLGSTDVTESRFTNRPYLWSDVNATWTVDAMTLAGGLAIGTGDFTISTVLSLDDWTPSVVQSVPFIIWNSHSSGNNRIELYVEPGGGIRLTFVDGAGSATSYVMGATLTDGETYRLTLACDRDGLAVLYVGSTIFSTVDISGSSAIDIGSGNANSSDIGRARGTPFRLYEFSLLDYLVTDVETRDLEDSFLTYADLTAGGGEAIVALLGGTLNYAAATWTWDDAGPGGNDYDILEAETVPAVGGDNSHELRIVTTATAWVGQDTVFDQLPAGHYDLAITAVTPGTPDVKVGSASGTTDDIVATVTLGVGSTDLTMLLTSSPTGDLLFSTTASTVTFIVSYKL